MSRLTRWPSWRQRRKGGEQAPTISRRLASPTSHERQRRPARRLRQRGSASALGADDGTAHPQEEGSEGSWRESPRSWQGVFTSFCRDMRRQQSTSREWARPRAKDAGGVAVASGRHGTTFRGVSAMNSGDQETVEKS